MSRLFDLRKRLLRASIWIFPITCACTQVQEDPKTRLLIELVDAPADYEQVWVEVTGVNVRVDGKEHALTDAFDKGSLRLDLLALTGGNAQLLADADLPSGELQEVQLLLGEAHAVVSGGNAYALRMPSTQQADLKLKVRERLSAGLQYRLVVDFDAGRSVVPLDEQTYLLKPVLRTSIEALSGSIEGSVNTPSQVYVLAGGDTLASTRTNAEGIFVLRSIPPGSYSVCFTPLQENSSALEVAPVQVAEGKVTLLPEVGIARAARRGKK